MKLLDALLTIKTAVYDGDGFVRIRGICEVLDSMHERCNPSLFDEFRDLYTSWSEFSGDHNYPVPSPSPKKSPRGAFMTHYDMYEGEYGATRMRLLDWCIEELRK